VPISRRELLQAAGRGVVAVTAAAPAAVLTACSGSPRPRPRPRFQAAAPAPATSPDWAQLRSRLAGTLILPGEPAYEAARRSYNPLFDARRPAAVARCVRTQDVQLCIEAAAASRLPIAARGGGHSYAGYSTPEIARR